MKVNQRMVKDLSEKAQTHIYLPMGEDLLEEEHFQAFKPFNQLLERGNANGIRVLEATGSPPEIIESCCQNPNRTIPGM